MKNSFKLLIFSMITLSLIGCLDSSSDKSNTSKTLHVYFNANNGIGTMAEETVSEGSNFTIPANTYTRSDYSFHGWNTEANGTGTSYDDQAIIENLTENITLYAIWDLQLHINFNANYGVGTMEEEIVLEGNNFTIPENTFTRDHSSFVHWNTQPNNSGINYNAGDIIINVSEDITLYAIWDLIKYIDFDEDQSLDEIFETVEDPNSTLSIQSDIAMSGNALQSNLGSTHMLEVPFNGTTNYRDFWVMFDFYVTSEDIFPAVTHMPLILVCDSTRFDESAPTTPKLIGTPLFNRYDDTEPLVPGFNSIRPLTNIITTNESSPNSIIDRLVVRLTIDDTMDRWVHIKYHVLMDTSSTTAGLDLWIDGNLALNSIIEGDAPEEIDFNALRIWDHDADNDTPKSNIYLDNIGLYTQDPEE